MTIEEMKTHEWSVSWSGGKDSTATIILMHEYGVPIKDIIYVRMMWDENLPATLPIMTEFADRAAEVFKEWGYKVNIVHSLRTAKSMCDDIYHRSVHRERNGKPYGITAFCRGMCRFTNCKQKTIQNIQTSEFKMIGYAADEVERLQRLDDKKCSIMVELGIKEDDTYEICKRYNLLSPLYELGIKRDGCWFCPNASARERNLLRKRYPELVQLINQSINQCSYDISKLSNRNNWIKDYMAQKNWVQMDITDYMDSDGNITF